MILRSFRPLAGIMVLIGIRSWTGIITSSAGGFRPLAGIMVLIGLTQVELGQLLGMFPSPCGDYGSYRRRPQSRSKDCNSSFRPLAGIMVLIMVNDSTMKL